MTSAAPSITFRKMSKAAKSVSAAPTAAPDLPFEEALKKLESVVESMESDELPLETLLARFEEGTRLAQICQTKLAQAELKIQQLEKDAAGEFVLKPVKTGEQDPVDL